MKWFDDLFKPTDLPGWFGNFCSFLYVLIAIGIALIGVTS